MSTEVDFQFFEQYCQIINWAFNKIWQVKMDNNNLEK